MMPVGEGQAGPFKEHSLWPNTDIILGSAPHWELGGLSSHFSAFLLAVTLNKSHKPRPGPRFPHFPDLSILQAC